MLELAALLDEGGDAKNAGRGGLVGQVKTANRTETKVVSVKPMNVDPTRYTLLQVVSDSWWKLVFGVAPDHDGCSIRRRGQSAS